MLALALFLVAATVFLQAIDEVPFHGDESEWINNGRYFRFVFLEGDVTSNVWRDSWLNRDQPPLGRYIIGGIVWASGTDPANVNRSYAWGKSLEQNRREGRIPEPHILLPVRRTMAVIGAAAVALLFVAGRLVGGALVGVVSALFATFSPLVQIHLVQARTEALLALFSALSLVVLLAFAGRYARSGSVPAPAWGIGLLLGLALATKLTAAVAVVGACAYGGIAALARLHLRNHEPARLLAWTAASGLLTLAVWIGVNPFLWPDPGGRTVSMLTQQQSIMVEQGAMFGNPLHLPLPARIVLVGYRTYVENSTPSFDYGGEPGGTPTILRSFTSLPTLGPFSVELLLAAVGLTALVRRQWTVIRNGARYGVEAAFLCWIVAFFGVIGANLSLDWPRYYVPTALFGSVLLGLGTRALLTFELWPGRHRGPVAAPRSDNTTA